MPQPGVKVVLSGGDEDGITYRYWIEKGWKDDGAGDCTYTGRSSDGGHYRKSVNFEGEGSDSMCCSWGQGTIGIEGGKFADLAHW